MFPLDSPRAKRRNRQEWLAEELRRQGLADRPPFSQALHERIWETLVREPRAEQPRAAALRPLRERLAWVAAAAAASACAVAVALLLMHWAAAPGVPTPPPVAETQPASPPLPEPLELPRVARVAPDVEDLPALVDLAAGPRWAWLDHDARLTVQTLAGQLPQDLANAWSNPGP